MCKGRVYEQHCSYHVMNSRDNDALPITFPVPSSGHSISPSNGADIEEEGVEYDDIDMSDFIDMFAGALDDPDDSEIDTSFDSVVDVSDIDYFSDDPDFVWGK